MCLFVFFLQLLRALLCLAACDPAWRLGEPHTVTGEPDPAGWWSRHVLEDPDLLDTRLPPWLTRSFILDLWWCALLVPPVLSWQLLTALRPPPRTHMYTRRKDPGELTSELAFLCARCSFLLSRPRQTFDSLCPLLLPVRHGGAPTARASSLLLPSLPSKRVRMECCWLLAWSLCFGRGSPEEPQYTPWSVGRVDPLRWSLFMLRRVALQHLSPSAVEEGGAAWELPLPLDTLSVLQRMRHLLQLQEADPRGECQEEEEDRYGALCVHLLCLCAQEHQRQHALTGEGM